LKKAKLTIPAEIDYLSTVRDFIDRQGVKNYFSSRVTNAMKLAVEEACTNIMRHGYANVLCTHRKIKIKTIIRHFSYTVIIYDQGKSFDPRQVRTPDLKKYVEAGRIGGLGIMMITRLVDGLDYRITKKGNEFHLIKYREESKRNVLFQLWFLMGVYARRVWR
jgi:serine/threonine-protein kinase RsbW